MATSSVKNALDNKSKNFYDPNAKINKQIDSYAEDIEENLDEFLNTTQTSMLSMFTAMLSSMSLAEFTWGDPFFFFDVLEQISQDISEIFFQSGKKTLDLVKNENFTNSINKFIKSTNVKDIKGTTQKVINNFKIPEMNSASFKNYSEYIDNSYKYGKQNLPFEANQEFKNKFDQAEFNKLKEQAEIARQPQFEKFEKWAKQSILNDKNITIGFDAFDAQATRFIQEYNYASLKKLSDDSVRGIRGALIEGMSQGKSSYQIYKDLLPNLSKSSMPIYRKVDLADVEAGSKRIQDIKPLRWMKPENRARMIARTEMQRAYNQGNHSRYMEIGIQRVKSRSLIGECRICATIIAEMPEGGWPIDNSPAWPIHPFAYEKNTQIYTNKGWKTVYEIEKDDLILSMNPKTKITEFIPFKNKIIRKNPYNYLYHIHNKWFDVKVSEHHDLLVYNGNNKPLFVKPNELINNWKIARTIENNNISPKYVQIGKLKVDIEDYIPLLAWYISDGVSEEKRININCHEKSIEKRKVMEPFLENFKQKYNITGTSQKEMIHFNSKDLANYFRKFGKSYEKYLPKKLFDFSQNDLKIFLDNYILCDGHKSINKSKINKTNIISEERVLYTSSKQLSEDLGRIINLAGFYPSFSILNKAGYEFEIDNKKWKSNYDQICIRINKSKYTHLSSCKIEKIPYEDDIVCLELEKYHTLWIKTELGKTHWNGNCRHPTIPVVDLKGLSERMGIRKVDSLDNIYPQYMRTASKPNIDFSNGFSQTVIDNVINSLNNLPDHLKTNNFFSEGFIELASNNKQIGNTHYQISNKLSPFKQESRILEMYSRYYYDLYSPHFPDISKEKFLRSMRMYMQNNDKIDNKIAKIFEEQVWRKSKTTKKIVSETINVKPTIASEALNFNDSNFINKFIKNTDDIKIFKESNNIINLLDDDSKIYRTSAKNLKGEIANVIADENAYAEYTGLGIFKNDIAIVNYKGIDLVYAVGDSQALVNAIDIIDKIPNTYSKNIGTLLLADGDLLGARGYTNALVNKADNFVILDKKYINDIRIMQHEFLHQWVNKNFNNEKYIGIDNDFIKMLKKEGDINKIKLYYGDGLDDIGNNWHEEITENINQLLMNPTEYCSKHPIRCDYFINEKRFLLPTSKDFTFGNKNLLNDYAKVAKKYIGKEKSPKIVNTKGLKVTNKQIQDVDNYVSGFEDEMRVINEFITGKDRSSYDLWDITKTFSELADNSKTTTDIKLYRVFTRSPEKFKIDDIFESVGTTSTTSDKKLLSKLKKQSNGLHEWSVEINVPKGTRLVDVEDLLTDARIKNNITARTYKWQKEKLLPGGTKYKISDIDIKNKTLKVNVIQENLVYDKYNGDFTKYIENKALENLKKSGKYMGDDWKEAEGINKYINSLIKTGKYKEPTELIKVHPYHPTRKDKFGYKDLRTAKEIQSEVKKIMDEKYLQKIKSLDELDILLSKTNYSKATENNIKHVREYQMTELNNDINKSLWNAWQAGSEVKFKGKQQSLTKVIKLNQTPEEIKVYRGIMNIGDVPPVKMTDWDVEDLVLQRGYLSTSLKKSVAESYADEFVYEITVPKGTNYLYMEDFLRKTGKPTALNDYEIVFNKNARLRWDKVDIENKIVHATLIDDSSKQIIPKK